MSQFGFISPVHVNYGYVAISIALLLSLCQGDPVNQVSIEDVIDLDENPSSIPIKHLTPLTNELSGKHTFRINHHINSNDVNIHISKADTIQKGAGSITAMDPDHDVIVDDEDLLASGSGSGSGDFQLVDGLYNAGDILTETTKGRGRRKHVDLSMKGNDAKKESKEDTRNKHQIDLHDLMTHANIDVIHDKRSGGNNHQAEHNVVLNGKNTKITFVSSLSTSSQETDDDSVNNNDFEPNDTTDDIENKTIRKGKDDDSIDEELDDLLKRYEDTEGVYDDEVGMNDDKGHDDSVYDLLNVQSDGVENERKWSKWRRVGPTFKVRVEQCNVKGQDSKADDCEKGLRVQVKSCTKEKGCGETLETSTHLSSPCDTTCRNRNGSTPRPLSPSSSPSPTPAPATTTPPTPKGCQYSLYDTKRRKYVFLRWDLSQVLTQSKVKRWCKKDNDQYMIMSTPTDVCRKYLHELCRASQKCKSNKPPRERGDFAEGCWRGLVFGDMLPIGLSNKQTIIYFICQRYSSDSAIGRLFGYKDTHFGTLYDSKLRAPVLSLHKMLQVGDETWPDSDYFIEHGLIEQKRAVTWLFSPQRKGIVTLRDLDRCYREQTCDLGRFQVLPEDYSRESGNTAYIPTPLIWPEWMNTQPEARTSTLTLTNTVPLHFSLHEEWTAAVKKVRLYAIQECGIPYVSDPALGHLGQLSSHRSNKSALYLTSGAIPSKDPSMKTGRDVPVPSHLWVAGCCVQKMVRDQDRHQNDVMIDSFEENTNTDTRISSFTFYINNKPGSRLATASIFRLEMLLQDFYKVKDEEPGVSLFPGQENACSDLRNDVSGWFQ